MILVDEIARVCHEANRAYCQALGDRSQPAWADAPEWQRSSALDGVAFHLEHPEAGPEASHENWMAEKLRLGWTYGRAKNAERQTHPSMVPFDQLPAAEQAKDFIFRAIVHALADLVLPEALTERALVEQAAREAIVSPAAARNLTTAKESHE